MFHYQVLLKNLNDLANNPVGMVTSDIDLFKNYNKESNLNLVPFESITKLFEAIDASQDVNFAIIPLEENLSSLSVVPRRSPVPKRSRL